VVELCRKPVLHAHPLQLLREQRLLLALVAVEEAFSDWSDLLRTADIAEPEQNPMSLLVAVHN
jgi:hypothetical protein